MTCMKKTLTQFSDYSGRKGGLFVAIVLLAIGVVLQMIVVGSSAQVRSIMVSGLY